MTVVPQQSDFVRQLVGVVATAMVVAGLPAALLADAGPAEAQPAPGLAFPGPIVTQLPGARGARDRVEMVDDGDLDGDGVLDLAVLRHDAATGSVATSVLALRGAGDGTFVVSDDIPLSTPANIDGGVVIGQFSGDSVPDVVSATDSSDQVLVHFGNGDGTFSGPGVLGVPTPAGADRVGPHILRSADLDGDGDTDIVVGYSSALRVIRHDGNGGYPPPEAVDVAVGRVNDVVIADLDDDGLADLVVAGTASLQVHLQQADGTFTEAANLPVDASHDANGYTAVVAGDFTGDGAADVAVGRGDNRSPNQVGVMAGGGDGTLALPAAWLDVPWNRGPQRNSDQHLATDLDGDGHLDVVLAATGTALTLFGDGSGGLTLRSWLPGTADADLGNSSTPAQTTTHALAGDVDGDGRAELIIGADGGTFSSINVLPVDDLPRRWGSAESFLIGEEYDNSLYASLADFDGDGILDILAIDFSGLYLAAGRGDGTFDPPVHTLDDGTCYVGYKDVTGDLNGDGHLDFVCHADRPLVVFGDGTGGVAGLQLVELGDPDVEFHLTSDVLAVDMDGAPGDELVVMSNVSGFGVTSSQAAAGEDRTSIQVFGWDDGEDALVRTGGVDLPAHEAAFKDWTMGLVAGAFDADGTTDLSTWFTPAGSATAQRVFISGDGAGGLGAPATVDSGLPHEDYLASRTGDMNGDGRLDIVSVTATGTGRAVLLELGNGDGTFAPPSAFPTADPGDGDLTGMAVADVDQDGLLDVVVDASRTIEVHLGDGAGGLAPADHLVRGLRFGSSVAVGDVDGDGRPDIIADAGRAGAAVHTTRAGTVDPPEPSVPNLQVESVVAPAGTLRAGDDVAVTMTVRNTGTGPALGQWRDQVAILTSRGARTLGSALIRGPLQPGDAVTTTLTGAWPATSAGPTDVVATTDRGGTVTESVEDDNTATSTATAAVDDLPYDTPTSGTVAAGRQRLHRIQVVGTAALLRVTGSSAVEMATARDVVPADSQLTALAAETLLNPGIHLLLLSGTATSGAGASYRLELTAVEPGIQSIAPSRVAAGPVSFEVTGAGFQPGTTVELRGQGTTLPASEVRRASSTRLIVTIDAAGAALGAYDVAVTTGGQEFVATDGLEVVDGEGARFEVFVSAPDRARLWRTSPVQVTVLNAGGLDALAPVVRLSADRARLGRTGDGAFRAAGIDFLAVADDGSRVLSPGESARITARFDPDPDATDGDELHFTARAYGVANTTPWTWTAARDRLRPDGLPDGVWDQAFDAFLAQVGDTAGSHALALHQVHEHLDDLGLASDRGDDLHSRMVARAVAGVPGADLAGTVRDARGPLVERDVLAVDATGDIVEVTTTIDGAYAFHDLAPTSYDVEVRNAIPSPAGHAHVPRSRPLDLVVSAPVTLSGRVFTPDGRGAGRVPVSVERVGQLGSGVGSAQTDVAGRYTIRDVRPGELRVVASVPGFLPATTTLLAAAAGPHTVPDLTAVEGRAVVGTVTDPGGAPVAGARVLGRAPDGRTSNASTTAADGTYEVRGLPAGPVTVTAFSEGVGQVTADLDLSAPTTTADLVLQTGGSVVGTISSTGGGALAGAVVLSDALRTDEVRTAGDGTFRIDGVPVGDSRIEVRADGHVPTSIGISVADGVETAADVTLPTVGVLEVTVTDGGQPLPDVPVTATLIGGLGGTVRTSPDGVAVLNNLVPGRYVVHAGTTAGPDSTRAVVDVLSGLNQLALGADLTPVTGVVRDAAGLPIPGVDVSAVIGDEPLLRTTTDADGAWTLRIADGVTVAIRATAADGSVGVQRDVAVGGAPLDVPITLGASTLSVTAGGPAGPTGGIEMSLRMDGLGEVGRRTSGPDGIATFTGLPDGDFELLGGGASLAPAVVTGTLAGSASISLALPAGRSTGGRVVDADGDPVADALIGATDPATGRTVLTSSDSTGEWTLTSLPGTSVTLRAGSGTDIVETELPGGATTVGDLVLDGAGAVVEGVVDDATGTPLLGRVVQLVRDGLPVGLTTTGNDGAYRFDGVPEGDWTLVLALGGAQSLVQPITVPATGSLAVDLEALPAIGWTIDPPFELGPPDDALTYNASLGGGVAPPPGPAFASAEGRGQQRSMAFAQSAGAGEVLSGLAPPTENAWVANNKYRWRDLSDQTDPLTNDCPPIVSSLERQLAENEIALTNAWHDLQDSYRGVREVYTAGMGEALSKGAYNGLKTWVTLSSMVGGGTVTTTTGAAGSRLTVVQADQAANALAGIGLPVIDTIAGTTGNALFAGGPGGLDAEGGASLLVGVGGGTAGLAGFEATSTAIGGVTTAYDWVKFKDDIDQLTDSQISTLVSFSMTEDRYLALARRHQELSNSYAASVQQDCDGDDDEKEDEEGDGPDDEGGSGGGGEDPPEPPGDEPPTDNPTDRPTNDRGPDGEGSGTSRAGQSADPNEIAGPPGVGPEGWIAAPATLGYSISFENQPSASLPATIVTITTQLDPDTDWSTFELGDVGWSDVIVDVPAGLQSWAGRVPVPGTDLVVDIAAGLDADGLVTWVLTTIDPATDDIPDDASGGFLPPNDPSTHVGEGFVDYSVAPASTTTGTEVTAQAEIVFDENAPIVTNTWVNTIDSSRPVADVSALPAETTEPTLALTWSAEDEGSGVATFDLFASVDGSPLFLYRSDLVVSTVDVPVIVGRTYGFAVIATDAVGLEEAALAGPEQVTTIVETEPADPGPRTRLRELLAQLEDLRDRANRSDRKWIAKAIADLRRADARDSWDDADTPGSDDDRLTGRDGRKVLDDLRKAVKELEKVRGVDVGPVVMDLVDIADALSAIALDMARASYEAAGCDEDSCKDANKEIGKALEDREDAAEERADGDLDKAVHAYRKAYERAWKALDRLAEAP